MPPKTFKEYIITLFERFTPTDNQQKKIRDEGVSKLKDPTITIENTPEDREKVAIMISRYLGGMFSQNRLLSDHVKPNLNKDDLKRLKEIDDIFYRPADEKNKRTTPKNN